MYKVPNHSVPNNEVPNNKVANQYHCKVSNATKFCNKVPHSEIAQFICFEGLFENQVCGRTGPGAHKGWGLLGA